MSDGGMHISFNGLSSIREFSIAEVKEHLASLRDQELSHLERVMSAYGIDSEPENQSDSQRMYVGLIADKAIRYAAAVEEIEKIGTTMDHIKLDISREITGQVLKLAQQNETPAATLQSHTTPKPSKT